MKRTFAIAVLALAFTCLSQSVVAASTAFTLETGTPAGFETLTEARHLVVDVYYGGQLVGALPASVEPSYLTFEHPQALAELLPPTLDAERLLTALSRPLARNARHICRSAIQTGCGVLHPADYDGAGLIFDENRFRADVFLAPELLPQTAAISEPFLPPSSTGFSWMQNLSGTWSGVRSETGDDNYSAALLGDTILSRGEHGLHSQWSLNNSQSRLYQLYWSHDYRGQAWSAGLLYPESDIGGFALTPQLYGVEYRSSYNSRTDLRYAQGAPLEVNMPVRGRVEVHRDERLVHSQLLDAGNQLLDTSAMPSGAYEVEIRTFDEDGRPLTQYQQFFAKDSRLPAPGEWRWAAQVGRPVVSSDTSTLPQSLNDTFAQFGLARRLRDNTGLFGNLAASDAEQIFELGGRWLGPYVELSPSFLYTADERSGYRLNALLRFGGTTLSASDTYLETAQPDNEARSATAASRLSLLGTGHHQRNIALNGTALDWRYALRYTERSKQFYVVPGDYLLDAESAAARELITVELRRNLFRNRHWISDLTLTHNIADGEQLTLANIELRFNENRRSHSARLQSGHGPGAPDTRAAFYSGWHNSEEQAVRIAQQLSGEVDANSHYLGGQLRVSGRRGVASSTLAYRNSSGDQSLNYLGNFNTSILSTGDSLAWGGDNALDSAVVVAIDGGNQERFDVLVDGVHRGTAKAGERSVIQLPSFGSYEIQLKPLSDGFYKYRESQQTVTLYPGNVAVSEYAVQTIVLVLGRLLKDGVPLANTRISIGDLSTVTDDYGVFQFELPKKPGNWQSPPVVWGNCQIPLPAQSTGDHWLNLGEINFDAQTCTSESAEETAQRMPPQSGAQ